MPRTRIVLHLPRELQVGNQDDLVRGSGLATRERVVPADAEPDAVDRRLELQAVAGAAVRVDDRLRDDAGDVDGLGVALDRDFPVDLQLVPIPLDRVRAERQLWVTL